MPAKASFSTATGDSVSYSSPAVQVWHPKYWRWFWANVGWSLLAENETNRS